MIGICNGPSRRLEFCALAIVALGAASCSRSRPFARSAPRRVPLPPPIVQEGLDEPMNLQPAPMSGSARAGAAYGPVISSSVAPPGSAGQSVDMRYPARRGERARLTPADPRAMTGPKLLSPIQPSSGETSVTLPPTPRNGDTPRASESNGKPAANSARVGTKSEAPRYTVTTEPDIATGAPVTTLEAIRALKDEGFNTVLNLSPQEEADRAESFEVSRAGMVYVSLPVTPQTLNRETLDKFNRILAEAKRPIYIHDSNGSRTGATWYLNRLLVAKLPEDAARRQAAKAGLKEPGSDELTTELWLAIARILSEND